MPNASPTHPDLVYASTESRNLALDLYLPHKGQPPYPLILWIHGGAWRSGDKSWCSELLPLVEEGYALASVSYRLSQEATFPAQIRDVKAAVRWLRVNATQWGLDPQRFAAGGSSAGGHLAALLGVSFYKKDWDRAGEHIESTPAEVSSAVQAVVDWYGPSDFLRMNDQPGEMDHFAPDSPESQLIGAPVQAHPERVAAANPISYIYPGFPPFLILHGDRDRIVLPTQSRLLYQALEKRWVRAELALIEGAGHGFEGQTYRQALDRTRAFLQRELRAGMLPRQVYYACTTDTFRPRTRHAVRWLNPYDDYELARAYWNLKPSNDLTQATWQAAHEMGYSYAAVVEDAEIRALAAVLRYSEAGWELAAVSTNNPNLRSAGYATSVCSFVTAYILGTGRIATTSTGINNTAMQRTAEGIGYQRV